MTKEEVKAWVLKDLDYVLETFDESEDLLVHSTKDNLEDLNQFYCRNKNLVSDWTDIRIAGVNIRILAKQKAE